MELVVAMVLMSIFMSMFTGAVLMMNNAMNKAQALNQTSGQLNQAFLKLDKIVRYASAISVPGQGTAITTPNTTADWYVEFLSTNTGTPICTQLWLQQASPATITPQLMQRTWTQGSFSAASTFSPLASGITNGGAAAGALQPFIRPPPSTLFEQLRVNFVSLSAPGSAQTTSASSFVLNAVNSTQTDSAVLICNPAGWRP